MRYQLFLRYFHLDRWITTNIKKILLVIPIMPNRKCKHTIRPNNSFVVLSTQSHLIHFFRKQLVSAHDFQTRVKVNISPNNGGVHGKNAVSKD